MFVGPDNGLLASAVAMTGGATRAVELANSEYHLPAPGPTFAGRDVFAPVTAHLCNGAPLTDFGLKSDPAARQAVVEQIPIRKIASVEEVAGWYVFLASDAARYATGIVVPVDGGLDAQQMALRPITANERGA